MPRITNYIFGRITIDGTIYRKDVIVHPKRVESPWWREEGHCLRKPDLASVLPCNPEVLIIGTGASGQMRVPDETLRAIQEEGIQVRTLPTAGAVALFNELTESGSDPFAALHLTC